MDEKEKKISSKTDEIDTVSGDIEKTEKKTEKKDTKSEPVAKKKAQEKNAGADDARDADAKEDGADEDGKDKKKRTRTPLSARTKKRLIRVAIVTVALLLVLATVLTVSTVLNNRPPKLEDVKDRFELLLTKSQEINEILWGAGLPTYARVERKIKSYEIEFEVEFEKKTKDENGETVTVKEKKLVQKALGYYLFEDDTYGTVVAYEYQARVMTGETTDVELESGETQTVNVYTVYDVESLHVIAEFQNGASRFARKTQEPIAGETPIFEKDGFYYYALPGYENEDLVYAGVYSGKEDSHYDYVRFDSSYKSTEDVRKALSEVYAYDYMAPLYEYLFTGAMGGMNDVYQPVYTDYVDQESDTSYLMKANSKTIWKWQALRKLTFDFSTMQMLEGESDANSVKVTIQYREEGKDGVQQMTVSFARESGSWYLNSPTY